MLTNWKTISNSIKKYKKLTVDLQKESTGFTKKENLKMATQRDKLERSLGGIADMKKTPDMIFIVDTNIEDLAVKEALRLNIPIVAILDTNSDPTGIKFPIPGNDDARRAINLYCDLIKQTILDAQKNISKPTEELVKNDNVKKEDLDNKKDEKKNLKKETPIKKTAAVKKEKKSPTKSFFAKVKSLTTKKTK
jgi:small subunit ribosomal protein S2